MIHKLEKYILTIVLVLLNVLVFLSYGLGDITVYQLLDLGANFAAFALDEEPLRLISSMFLHGNLIHLIVNCYSLFYLGSQVEAEFGSIRMMRIYLYTGLAAGLASIQFNLFTISVGASGAIFGLYGYYIMYNLEYADRKGRFSLIINFMIYMTIMFLVGNNFNFDNAGHIGGAVAGILLRLLDRKVHGSFKLDLITVPIILLWYFIIPRFQPLYFQFFQDFLKSEKKITSVIYAPWDEEKMLNDLWDIKAIPDSMIDRVRSIGPIPDQLSRDTSTLVAFYSIRKRQIDHYIHMFSNESYLYLDSVEYLDRKAAEVGPLDYVLNFQPETEPADTTQNTSKHTTPAQQFYDENWFECDISTASYYRIGEKDSLGDWHGFVHDFYMDGSIQMKGKYYKGLKSGVFRYYNADSTYSAVGRCYDDERIGKWESFYSNNLLESEIRYVEGKVFLENSWDSLGKSMVTNRQGIEIIMYPNGNIRSKRTVKDGLSEGYTEGYHEDGTLRYREYYEQGELIRGVSYSKNGTHIYDVSTYLPYPNGGFDNFYDYLRKNNPLAVDSIDAEVVLRFDVHASGKINNIRYLRRHNPQCDSLAKQLLLIGPEWNPAMMRGIEPISSFAQIYVQF